MKYRPNYNSVATGLSPSFVTIIKYPIPYSWLLELTLETQRTQRNRRSKQQIEILIQLDLDQIGLTVNRLTVTHLQLLQQFG